MRIVLVVLIALFSSLPAFSQKSATTTDGKKVILNDNGTWKYADAKTTAPTTKPVVKPAAKKAAPTGPALPVRCTAVTAGKRCNRTTLSANKKCWQHGGN